ncbi:hypothetical protein QYE76_028425 [Lolium multiflorum]|uniref:non-specific serine/threonine protein kinase n=1 Tax=Lolium multiflorum TaxID=4521 RepID=A0AAD8QNP5_LOLMU|nr:hypothetical protein QYE76_028425 [Lolium multiflorum]
MIAIAPMGGAYIFTTSISFLLMLMTIAATKDHGSSYLGGYKRLYLPVWFTGSSGKTVAWTANRDAPVNGRGSRLAFRRDGGLDLLDYNGAVIWSTNTTATRASRAELLDSGNLVIVDPDGQQLWRSFDSPTDTLLPSQPMTRNIRLVSASSRGLFYSGLYTLFFDNDNQLIKLMYNGPEVFFFLFLVEFSFLLVISGASV